MPAGTVLWGRDPLDDPTIAQWIGAGVAFACNDDILIPLDGTHILPHAILRVASGTTSLGRALAVAIDDWSALPDPDTVDANDRARVALERRQIVAILRRLVALGLVSQPDGRDAIARVPPSIPWRER